VEDSVRWPVNKESNNRKERKRWEKTSSKREMLLGDRDVVSLSGERKKGQGGLP